MRKKPVEWAFFPLTHAAHREAVQIVFDAPMMQASNSYRGFESLLVRQFPQSQRFSGPGGVLEMPSNGDVLMMLLLTALAGKQPESAPEIGFFSAPVDRETSVRWGRSASISIT
jgi:hypothetical protein